MSDEVLIKLEPRPLDLIRKKRDARVEMLSVRI
jgi:hypothetical protein